MFFSGVLRFSSHVFNKPHHSTDGFELEPSSANRFFIGIEKSGCPVLATTRS